MRGRSPPPSLRTPATAPTSASGRFDAKIAMRRVSEALSTSETPITAGAAGMTGTMVNVTARLVLR